MDHFSSSPKRFKSAGSMPSYFDSPPFLAFPDIFETFNDSNATVPDAAASTPSPSPATAQGPEFPSRFIQLGNNVLVGVSTFLNSVQVHIRKHVVKDGCLVPTKDGINMPPSVWERLQVYFQCIRYEDYEEHYFVEKKIFLTATSKPAPSLSLQTMFRSRSNGALQLSLTRVQLNDTQLDRIRVCGSRMQQFIADELFGISFKKAVKEGDTFPLVDSRIVPKFHPAEAQTLLLEGLHHLTRQALIIMLQGFGIGSELESDMQIAVYFFRAVCKLDMKRLATSFVWMNPELYPYIADDFLDSLQGSEIISYCERSIHIEDFGGL